MKDIYETKVVEDHGRGYLSVTHNGYQWGSISIKNLEEEIPQIIEALQQFLEEKFGGQKKREPGRCEECYYPFPHHSPGCSLRRS